MTIEPRKLDGCKRIKEENRLQFRQVFKKKWGRDINFEKDQQIEAEIDKYKINPDVFDVPR